jgi:hypothetical protein
MTLRWGVLLLAALGMGCSAARVVRLDTGTGAAIVHVPRTDVETVRLERGEFKEAVTELARDVRPFEHPLRDARRLFGVPRGVARTSTRDGARGSSLWRKVRTPFMASTSWIRRRS